MNRPRILALVFLAVAAAQLAVPAARIWQYESTLRDGHPYKLRTLPVDPYDAFRGRYVALRYEFNGAPWKGKEPPEHGSTIFASVAAGPDGFLEFTGASGTRPEAADYLEVKAAYSVVEGRVSFQLPFDRFYLEESIAPEAENIYRMRSAERVKRDTYAVVRIRDGRGVIEQIYVGEKTLVQAAKEALARK